MDLRELWSRLEATPAAASVRTVFGEPVRVGDRVIIPVAQVCGGVGLGFGQRPAAGAEGGPSAQGGGGGGGFTARPLAVVVATPERVEVQPVLDLTRLAVVGMLLLAWNVFWISRTVRVLATRRPPPRT
jgi:uncharacterized spore protein YtfJ